MTPRPNASDYRSLMASLLPQGRAWDFAPESLLNQLLAGIAEEFARIDTRATDLHDEADPRTTLELLPNWERVAALPDDCFGEPDNVRERQIALAQKITGLGGQNIAFYTELASSVGYLITITEHRVARIGSFVGDNLNSEDWQFAWEVHVKPFDGDLPENQLVLAVAEIGNDVGVHLRGWGAIDLECILHRYRPAHTHTIFTYEIEPEAEFWINFTEGE